MKAFRDLIRFFNRSLEGWRQLQSRVSETPGVLFGSRQKSPAQDAPTPLNFYPGYVSDPVPEVSAVGRLAVPRKVPKRRKPICKPQLLLALTILVLTAAIGQRFYNQPELQAETAAPKTIIAPKGATVIDQVSTEEQQRSARNGVLKVLKIDSGVNESIYRTLSDLIQQGQDARTEAGPLPFIATDILSTPAQQYIRQASEPDWQKMTALVLPTISPDPSENLPQALAELSADARFQALTWQQQVTVRELFNYRQRTSQQQFLALQVQIANARHRYQRAAARLNAMANEPRTLPQNSVLLDLTPPEWAATQTALHQAADRMLAQGIMPGLPPEIVTQAARVQLRPLVPKIAEDLAVQILKASLQPNLIEDTERTRIQAEKAAEAVEPVKVSVKAGEVIVRAGEPITQSAFALLDYFGLSQRRFNWLGFTGFGVLVGGAILIFWGVERMTHLGLRQRDYLLVCMLVLGTAGLSVFDRAAFGLPAVGFLTGTFYGAFLGGTLVGLLAILLPIGANVSPIPLIASAAGGWVGSSLASRMRSREELALLGGGVGMTQGLVYLLLTLVVSAVSPSAWYNILMGAVVQGAYGVVSSILALGLSPYLEHVFDLLTPIRLAELANPNRPLLKRLASEAPGTFQHTLFVASLAEAAARALGCNVELVRTGTLYHDIGKMHDPLGFIENQMGGPNKHDTLNDPWLSAEIIRKHVTEGLVMARKHRLPNAVAAFIPEHQGTMLIGYFYHHAQEQAAHDPTLVVRESDFRYDGPIPQSPETGIVMLADSCEAALRSLKEATPEEALAMVNRILRARWKDNQLVDSGLNREHLAVIAEVFVQVWLQYNHKRIAYPKASLATRPSP